ncbi:hypothetical protein H5410_016530 [Solanum commersonii]|uniref:Uncharacterized protein n=1 Tax=Solanum commersonii TaxID=4109 RepID=A0A9J5ZXL6_SOLCO|nr:hypothetical protein H5410_016530 [Solanum commersonii]
MNSCKKIEETIVVDRISQLSEALLIHIFSFTPTAQTLRTSEEVCALPEYLYTYSSMMTLVLRFCYFDANVVIAWKSIKSIKLKWIVLSNDHIMNLLLGFPALEAMELSCFKVTSEIRSSKLKRLNLISYNDD